MLTFNKLTESITLAQSNSSLLWKCNGLIIETESQTVLIDCNFDKDEITELMNFVKKPISAYFVTHIHVDHANNLHIINNFKIPIFLPYLEGKYLYNVDNLFIDSGSYEMKVENLMKELLINKYSFKNVKSFNSFKDEDFFFYDSITLKTISLPGHSPGHTGFVIHDTNNTNSDLLFVSDIGIDSFGAWYGFKYSNLSDYKNSIHKAKKIYNSGNYLLASSHSETITKKDNFVFDKIIDTINITESKLIKNLNLKTSTKLHDITLTGIYYRESSINKMNSFFKKLYYSWEFFILKNHLIDLEKQNMVKQTSNDEWILV